MAQITSGIRSILSSASVYDFVQKIMGADRVRREIVELINPFPNQKILDIGSGTSEILNYLPLDVNYWGFDISQDYIKSAKERFGSRGVFECGLLSEETARNLPKFDAILSLGVLHHLNDIEVTSFLKLAHGLLKPGGKFISFDPCFSDNQNPMARFLISMDRGQNVRTAEQYSALAKSEFIQIQGILRQRTWIPYTHWFMECTK